MGCVYGCFCLGIVKDFFSSVYGCLGFVLGLFRVLFRVCCVPVDTTHDFVSLSGARSMKKWMVNGGFTSARRVDPNLQALSAGLFTSRECTFRRGHGALPVVFRFIWRAALNWASFLQASDSVSDDAATLLVAFWQLHWPRDSAQDGVGYGIRA